MGALVLLTSSFDSSEIGRAGSSGILEGAVNFGIVVSLIIGPIIAFVKILTERHVIFLFVQLATNFLCFWSFWSFVQTYLRDDLHLSLTLIRTVTWIFAALVRGC
jgi:hypothetical protein